MDTFGHWIEMARKMLILPAMRVWIDIRVLSSFVFVLSVASISQASASLVVSELMYHPAADEEMNSLEFVELLNTGDASIDLNGFSFDRGINYSFPANATIRAGEYWLLAKDPALASSVYGDLGFHGPYDGTLSNNGERLRLRSEAGETVISFRYGTNGDWPAAADGAGHSLVFDWQDGDDDRPRDWSASYLIGGSPGQPDRPDQEVGEPFELVGLNDLARYFKGTREPSGGETAWADVDFQTDGDWVSGPGGFGYSNNGLELSFIGTLMPDMRGRYASVYARYSFILTERDLDRIETLIASVAYDDGYVLYLNGERVAGVNVSGNPPRFNALANSATDYVPETHDLTAFRSMLIPGVNVLAIQGHNGSFDNSSDFVMAPSLWATLAERPTEDEGRRDVLINEILANSDEESDWIELYNPTEQPVDLSGCWLSDDSDQLTQYRIPEATRIEPNGYLVLDQEAFGFGLTQGGEAIYLTEPDQTHVIDAYRFGVQQLGVSLGRVPDGSDDWMRLSPSPSKPNIEALRSAEIVLNEIMYNPMTKGGEYVEIRHSGEEAIDMNGWSFVGLEFRFSGETRIEPGEFIVIAEDPVGLVREFGLEADPVFGPFDGRLSNRGERIGLLDADYVLVDWIRYDDLGAWPVTADGLGASLERRCISSSFNEPLDWNASPIGGASPGRMNAIQDCDPVASPAVVISEIHYHPFTEREDNRRAEFLEIWNNSNVAVDLTGWGVEGAIQFAFESGTLIPADRGLVLAWDPELLVRRYNLNSDWVVGPYGGELPNGGGEVVLYQADGRVVDWLDYNDDTPWPSLADGFGEEEGYGFSLERICLDRSGASPQNWTASLPDTPTPLTVNTADSCDSYPVVMAIQREPSRPTARDDVMLHVFLAEYSENVSAVLEWWVDDMELAEGEPHQFEPLTLVSREDGGETLLNAMIPAQAENAIVRYRVLLEMNGEVQALEPRRDRDAFEWHAYYVEPVLSSRLPVFNLFINSASWLQLHRWTNPGRVSGGRPNPTWNNETAAVFVADGVVHDVRVRHQGSRWNRKNGSMRNFPCPSHGVGEAQVRSWRIRFPAYRNHDGMDVMHLQKQSGWPQRISFELFKMAGVPAPRTSWANLRINGCDFNNDAFVIERPGADMAARWFDEVGDLFKSQGFTGNEGPWSWGDARLIRGNLNGFREQERYEYTYNRKTHKWKNTPSDGVQDVVEPLIEGLHVARGHGRAALRAYLLDNFDVDRTLRYIATINYVGTFDDMFQNHFLYREASSGKWMMFPWDMDNTLGGAFGQWNANPFRGADEGRIGSVGNRSGWWNRIKDSFFIAFEEEFLSVFDYLNNEVYSPSLVRPMIEESAAFRGLSPSSVETLMSHFERRHNYLNQVIESTEHRPELLIERLRDNGGVLLSWPYEAFFFRLETARDAGSEWIPIEDGIRSEGGRNQAVLEGVEPSRLFRLKRD